DFEDHAADGLLFEAKTPAPGNHGFAVDLEIEMAKEIPGGKRMADAAGPDDPSRRAGGGAVHVDRDRLRQESRVVRAGEAVSVLAHVAVLAVEGAARTAIGAPLAIRVLRDGTRQRHGAVRSPFEAKLVAAGAETRIGEERFDTCRVCVGADFA